MLLGHLMSFTVVQRPLRLFKVIQCPSTSPPKAQNTFSQYTAFFTIMQYLNIIIFTQTISRIIDTMYLIFILPYNLVFQKYKKADYIDCLIYIEF